MAWQERLDGCEKRHRHLMALVAERAKQRSVASRAYVDLSESISSALTTFAADIEALGVTLEMDAQSGAITDGEARRRRKIVEALQTKQAQLRDIFRGSGAGVMAALQTEAADRSVLLSGRGVSDLGVTRSWSDDDSYSDGDGAAALLQHRINREGEIAAQDRGLDSLHEAIVRQKRVAEVINSEVTVQNELIDDIGRGMDETRQRLITTTESVRGVGRRQRTCGYWIAIFLLLVVIVIIVCIPKRH